MNGVDPSGEFLIGLIGGFYNSIQIRSQEGVTKGLIYNEAKTGLGYATVASLAAMGMYAYLGLPVVTGATAGFKLGFGSYFANRASRKRQAMATAIGNTISAGIGYLTGLGIKGLGKLSGLEVREFPGFADLLNTLFVSFSNGYFAGATDLRQGDAIFDIVDAGFTRVVTDLFEGQIWEQGDSLDDVLIKLGDSAGKGVLDLAIIKLVPFIWPDASGTTQLVRVAEIRALLQAIGEGFQLFADNHKEQ